MRRAPSRPWLIRSLLLCGLMLAAWTIDDTSPVAAFDMVHGGQPGALTGPVISGPAAGHESLRPAPPPMGGVFIARPPYGSGWPRHPPIAGGLVGGGNSNGGLGRGRNSGGNNNNGPTASGGQPRFVSDEVITEFVSSATPQAIDQIARRYGLTRLESENFELIGGSLYRWRIAGRRSVANVVRALGTERLVASVQPNYIFTLQEQASKVQVPEAQADKAPVGAAGDPAQYVLTKLQVEQARQMATGKNVLVAVIDSEIDAKHPDLDGAVVKSFDALDGAKDAHGHGTAIAGAIASHGKLLGIATGAKLLAVHAFDDTPGKANGTSFAIYKGLQWAVDNEARVVNMSFVGPADPALRRILAAAYDKGTVLVAAAGNAGPHSKPLYPAADPDVIAVTATDADDHLFAMANRGRYIAVAAPGVDILALAPGGAYQITTGTSIAAAHVSAVAALLLERSPSLKPSDIRAALIATAERLGPIVPDSDFGAGLVNAYRALTWLDRRPAEPNDGAAQAKQ